MNDGRILEVQRSIHLPTYDGWSDLHTQPYHSGAYNWVDPISLGKESLRLNALPRILDANGAPDKAAMMLHAVFIDALENGDTNIKDKLSPHQEFIEEQITAGKKFYDSHPESAEIGQWLWYLRQCRKKDIPSNIGVRDLDDREISELKGLLHRDHIYPLKYFDAADFFNYIKLYFPTEQHPYDLPIKQAERDVFLSVLSHFGRSAHRYDSLESFLEDVSVNVKSEMSAFMPRINIRLRKKPEDTVIMRNPQGETIEVTPPGKVSEALGKGDSLLRKWNQAISGKPDEARRMFLKIWVFQRIVQPLSDWNSRLGLITAVHFTRNHLKDQIPDAFTGNEFVRGDMVDDLYNERDPELWTPSEERIELFAANANKETWVSDAEFDESIQKDGFVGFRPWLKNLKFRD